MGKWVVTAVVLLAGVLAWLLVPRNDSVGYHIKRYREAERRLRSGNETFMDRAGDAWVQEVQREDPYLSTLNAWKYHQRELIRLRYLEEQTFVFSNVALSNIGFAIGRAVARRNVTETGTIKGWPFYSAGRDPERTNGVRVVARKGIMPTQEEVLREIESAAREER